MNTKTTSAVPFAEAQPDLNGRLLPAYRWLTAALALVLLTAGGKDAPPAQVLPDIVPYAKGERLQYRVTVLGTEAGRGTIEIAGVSMVDGRPVFKIKGEADTNGFFDNVYPLHDRAVVTWDPYRSWLGKLQYSMKEAKHVIDTRMTFDPATHRVTGTRTVDGRKMRINDSIPRGAFDALTVPYYLRTKKLKAGQSFLLQMHNGRRLYNMTAKVQGKQTVWTPAATYKAFPIETEIRRADNSRPNWKQRLTLWIEDGKHHLLVRVDIDSPLGKVQALLEGTRLPHLPEEGEAAKKPASEPSVEPAKPAEATAPSAK